MIIFNIGTAADRNAQQCTKKSCDPDKADEKQYD